MHQVSRPPSSALAKLSPAYFGMVMATGIVSIGAWRLGLPRLAWGLFGLNLAAYGLLWLLFVARLIRYPRLFARDLVDVRRPGARLEAGAGDGPARARRSRPRRDP